MADTLHLRSVKEGRSSRQEIEGAQFIARCAQRLQHQRRLKGFGLSPN